MLDATTVSSRPRSRDRAFALAGSDLLVGLLLAVVMVVGGYFRFVGQNWDDFTHLHPDERFLTGVAAAMGGPVRSSYSSPAEQQAQLERCLAANPMTGGAGGFFDADCSTWNPHNTGPTNGLYVYGTLPLFLARTVGEALVQITGSPTWAGYNGVHLVWRALSALAEMAAVVAVFLIGLRLAGRWVGLLAAALYAAAVLSIQLSHFGTVDAMASAFATFALLFAVRVQFGGRWTDYALFGLMFGAALASRINLAPLAGLIVLAAGLRALPALDRALAWGERERALLREAAGLVIAGVVTLVVFRLANPYTFMGPGILGLSLNPRWVADLNQARYLVSGQAEMPPNWQWVGRTPYLFAWNNMVLWGMGAALGLAGWLGWLWAGARLVRGLSGALALLLPFVWVLVYFGWLGANWVASMRYFLPLYPALALLAAWALVELVKRAGRSRLRRGLALALLAGVTGFTLLWAAMFTSIYRQQLTRVQASHWFWENVSGDFSMRVEGPSVNVPLVNVPLYNGYGGAPSDSLLGQTSPLYAGQPVSYVFVAPADGTIRSVRAPHLSAPEDNPAPAALRVAIYTDLTNALLAEGTLTASFHRANHPLGDSYEIALGSPVSVRAGESYRFVAEVMAGGPVLAAGEVVSHEGAWDDAIPYSVCTLPHGVTLADNPPPGLLSAEACNGRNAWSSLIVGHQMQMAYEDEPYKRDLILRALNDSQYLTISSNRFYDSLSRIPIRWPMSNRYYAALFSGELGYELAAVFQSAFELGPLRISDQHLPIYTSPAWLNEFEAEEAFHVYDHPVVFVFRKTADYDPENARRVLYEAPLNRLAAVGSQFVETCPQVFLQIGGGGCDLTLVDTVTWSSLQADQAPTQLKFTPERRAIQYGGGTWSELFDSQSAINTQPLLTIAAWWLAIVLIGWAAWPLLYALFPSFADRGYSLAKTAGLLIAGWLAWYGASAGLATWSRGGVLAALLLVFALGAALTLRGRAGFVGYVRENWRRLAAVEAITLLAFLGFLAVRLTNPDLWHYQFGGEKPMDFAYFNGVLRSTIFPAIDPWHAGGFLNYYYFGYVIVGGPTLLLGVIPSTAYNLILPTLFALTGIGAFSVAFNAVSHWRERRSDGTLRRVGSPWLAGTAALLLAVVLGNLDTPRVFGAGVAQLGGYRQPAGLEAFLIERYTAETGEQPAGAVFQQLVERANRGDLLDRLSYELDHSFSVVSSLLRGAGQMLQGASLPIAPNRWYWGPTRVLAETPGVEGQAITEIPFFTFLYGDLHAHMIAMPLHFIVMAFALNEVLLAGRDSRGSAVRWLALALGAGTAGLLRATNTWDWITYMLLGVAAVGFAWWLAWRTLSRRALIDLSLRVGGFVALSFVAALPYTTWYAATYGRVLPWTGGKTPLWAYFDLHGLFLFLIASLLVWDTARWFRSVYVRDLRGMWWLLVALALAAAALALGLLFTAMAGYQAALVAVPLIVWIAVLFFRAGQTREMQVVLVLAGLALSLTLGVEFVVLDGDIGRQNTVFKFYIQAWMLFAAAGGAAFAWLMRAADNWSGRLRGWWLAATALLVAVAALYPVMASRGKALDRMTAEVPFTLDGMTWMQYAQHAENGVWLELADDYALIRWLQENVQGTPVIVEAQSAREYLWSGRVAINTGLPSVLGWRFHQTQQRTLDPLPSLVNQRRANINGFYSTTDIAAAWRMIQFYDIEYVIVGGLERAYYPEVGLAKFEEMARAGMLERVFEHGEAVVYRVNRDVEMTQVG